MIPLPSGVRVWIAVGRTDMRPGMALLVQEALKRDPHGGDLYVSRGKSRNRRPHIRAPPATSSPLGNRPFSAGGSRMNNSRYRLFELVLVIAGAVSGLVLIYGIGSL